MHAHVRLDVRARDVVVGNPSEDSDIWKGIPEEIAVDAEALEIIFEAIIGGWIVKKQSEVCSEVKESVRGVEGSVLDSKSGHCREGGLLEYLVQLERIDFQIRFIMNIEGKTAD